MLRAIFLVFCFTIFATVAYRTFAIATAGGGAANMHFLSLQNGYHPQRTLIEFML